MKTLNHRKSKYISGISILIIGILLFVMLFSPWRNVGIILISIAALFLAIAAYSNSTKPDNKVFRSRTRDEMLRHHDGI